MISVINREGQRERNMALEISLRDKKQDSLKQSYLIGWTRNMSQIKNIEPLCFQPQLLVFQLIYDLFFSEKNFG